MLPNWYNTYKDFIENSLNNYLKEYFKKEQYEEYLNEITFWVFYAVAGWKRIRSILALEFYITLTWKTIFDIDINDDIVKFCISLELIHAYSLVHDDLPAMDNDEFRRWELTTWKKFWETNWILIWDLLNTLSFEVLTWISDSTIWLRLVWLLSYSIWFFGMIGWQVLDLYFERNISKLNLEKLFSLHNKKTWALIVASILGWIILSKKNIDNKLFEKYARNIGLAFQIKDDILDVEWTFEETWKSVGWEQKWFVYFLSIEKSKEYLKNLILESLEIIKTLHSEKLEFLTKYIEERKK